MSDNNTLHLLLFSLYNLHEIDTSIFSSSQMRKPSHNKEKYLFKITQLVCQDSDVATSAPESSSSWVIQ